MRPDCNIRKNKHFPNGVMSNISCKSAHKNRVSTNLKQNYCKIQKTQFGNVWIVYVT